MSFWLVVSIWIVLLDGTSFTSSHYNLKLSWWTSSLSFVIDWSSVNLFSLFLSLQRKSARSSRYDIVTVNSKLARAVYNDLILYIRRTFFLIPAASRTQMVARPKCSMMTIIQESVTNSFSFGGGGGGCGLDLLRTWRVNFSFIFFSSCSFSRLWGHVGANR